MKTTYRNEAYAIKANDDGRKVTHYTVHKRSAHSPWEVGPELGRGKTALAAAHDADKNIDWDKE